MTDFNATRATRTAAHAQLQAASAAARTFLMNAKRVLSSHWGNDYSQNWASAGWTDNTAAVPDTQPGRLAGQPGGQTVQVRATAVNPAGESVPSTAVAVAVG